MRELDVGLLGRNGSRTEPGPFAGAVAVALGGLSLREPDVDGCCRPPAGPLFSDDFDCRSCVCSTHRVRAP
jgi:hypothetical protein